VGPRRAPVGDRCRLDDTARTADGRPTTAPHLPVRTCVGCRKRTEQAALLRVVAVQDDTSTSRWQVVPDVRRRRPGRGAHVHPDPECLQTAIARRAFGRALRLPAGSEVDVTAVQEWFGQQRT
jgi:uncharacterized protein